MSDWSGPPRGWSPFVWTAMAVMVALIAAIIVIARVTPLLREPFDEDQTNITYVTAYDAVIGPEDRQGDDSRLLTNQLAILQRDRENVHVRDVRQAGDVIDTDVSGSSYFAEARNRALIGTAVLSIASPDDRLIKDQLTASGVRLHVMVHRRDGQLVISVSRYR